MAVAWRNSGGSLGKVFMVLNLNGRRQGIVVEPTDLEVQPVVANEDTGLRQHPKIYITGFVVAFVDADARPDLDESKQLPAASLRLKE